MVLIHRIQPAGVAGAGLNGFRGPRCAPARRDEDGVESAPVRGRALYTALYTVKRPLYRLYFGLSLSRLACVVYSVYSYTAYTQYSVYSIQRYTPSLWTCWVDTLERRTLTSQ